MKTVGYFLFLDPCSGISGCMFLGLLADLGVPMRVFRETVERLGLSGEISISRRRVFRNGISCARVKVKEKRPQRKHRRLEDIQKLIRKSKLEEPVKELSERVFLRIAEAEAEIHGVEVTKVHFHEVGALDSITDIVCGVRGISWLGIEKTISRPPVLGTGSVMTEHGLMPVPSPATTRILEGVPVVMSGTRYEMTTPTGAALLRELAEVTNEPVGLRVLKTGYGAGDEREGSCNCLRGLLCELDLNRGESVCEISVNLDDMTGEDMAAALKVIETAGALDCWFETIQGKKGRPGVILKSLVRPNELQDILDLLLEHTTSSGVRYVRKERVVQERDIIRVKTSFGLVRVKRFYRGSRLEGWKIEHADLEKISVKKGVPVFRLGRDLEREIIREGLIKTEERKNEDARSAWRKRNRPRT